MWGKDYWPVYLISASIGFFIPELIALASNVANTLSDYSWHELNVTTALEFSKHTVAWYTSFSAWLLFVVVITLHIWFRSV